MNRQPEPNFSIPPADAMRILDEPVSVTLGVQLRGNLAYETKRYCDTHQRSTASVMREALQEWLQARGVTVE